MANYNIRNAKGQFTKVDATTTDAFVWTAPKKLGGIRISYADISAKLDKAIRAGQTIHPQDYSTLVDSDEDTIDVSKLRVIQEGEEGYDPRWTKLSNQKKYEPTTEQTKTYYQWDDGTISKFKPVDDYKYSYAAEHTYGINEEEQKRLYELFKQATEILIQINKIDTYDIGRRFNTNINLPPEELQRKIAAAERIVSKGVNYLNEVASDYKAKFLTNFQDLISIELHDRLTDAIERVSTLEFLKIIKEYELSSSAFTAQSKFNQGLALLMLNDVEKLIRKLGGGDIDRDDYTDWNDYVDFKGGRKTG